MNMSPFPSALKTPHRSPGNVQLQPARRSSCSGLETMRVIPPGWESAVELSNVLREPEKVPNVPWMYHWPSEQNWTKKINDLSGWWSVMIVHYCFITSVNNLWFDYCEKMIRPWFDSKPCQRTELQECSVFWRFWWTKRECNVIYKMLLCMTFIGHL